jgi:hypothetical protein
LLPPSQLLVEGIAHLGTEQTELNKVLFVNHVVLTNRESGSHHRRAERNIP